jgi:hypothetical protein
VKPKDKPPVVAETRDPPPPPPTDELRSIDISNTVQRQMMALRACGQDHVTGWVTFQVEVAPDGSAKLAKVHPGANIKAFRECVEKVIVKLAFEAKPKGGKGTVRMMFHEPPPPPGGGY